MDLELRHIAVKSD